MTALERPESKPRPTQARAHARRLAILDAANSFVLSGEIDKITTTTVAQRAGIPVGSVYRYFDNRVDMLDQLYREAYDDIETSLIELQSSMPPKMPIPGAIGYLLGVFTELTRSHPSFRTLTKWANQHYSLWEVTPGPSSSLAAFIEKTLNDAGVRFPPERRVAATKTIVTVVSVLVDQSLEEDDEDKAKALISELGYILNQYLR